MYKFIYDFNKPLFYIYFTPSLLLLFTLCFCYWLVNDKDWEDTPQAFKDLVDNNFIFKEIISMIINSFLVFELAFTIMIFMEVLIG